MSMLILYVIIGFAGVGLGEVITNYLFTAWDERKIAKMRREMGFHDTP